MYMVRWKVGRHKAFDGTLMSKPGEWRYYTIDDGWREGACLPNGAKVLATREEAVDALMRIVEAATKGERVCTWYHAPDKKNPHVEIVEVTPRYATAVVGYDLKK